MAFWPQQVEARGPWQRLQELTASFRPQTDWDAEIPSAALAEGAELLQARRPAAACGPPAAQSACWCARPMERRPLPAGRCHRCVAAAMQDERVAHEMEWPSVQGFWDAMTRQGPWHRCKPGACWTLHLQAGSMAVTLSLPSPLNFPSLPHPNACSRRLLFGDGHMEELRLQFMAADGPYADPAAPLRHTATARIVCLRRRPHAAL